MSSQLPPGWQIFHTPDGTVMYVNVSTNTVQTTPPMAAAAAALALPPGWTQMTNDSGRTVYINQSLNRVQFEFPQAEAELAQAPSAPPVDPRTNDVKRNYFPHSYKFSHIDPEDIITMLYHPDVPPELTADDIDLIINNYVGTEYDQGMRNQICGNDSNILSCAQKLFKTNAFTAIYEYSYKLEVQNNPSICDVPFRWNPHTERKTRDPPTAILSSRLFPLNLNTVRWLCSTDSTPYPTLDDARQNEFMLNFFDAKQFSQQRSSGKTAIQVAIDERERISSPDYQRMMAKRAEDRRREEAKVAEQHRIANEQYRIAEKNRREEARRLDEQRKASFHEHMSRYHGGLKSKRKQRSKRKQSKRKQQSKRRT